MQLRSCLSNPGNSPGTRVMGWRQIFCVFANRHDGTTHAQPAASFVRPGFTHFDLLSGNTGHHLRFHRGLHPRENPWTRNPLLFFNPDLEWGCFATGGFVNNSRNCLDCVETPGNFLFMSVNIAWSCTGFSRSYNVFYTRTKHAFNIEYRRCRLKIYTSFEFLVYSSVTRSKHATAWRRGPILLMALAGFAG